MRTRERVRNQAHMCDIQLLQSGCGILFDRFVSLFFPPYLTNFISSSHSWSTWWWWQDTQTSCSKMNSLIRNMGWVMDLLFHFGPCSHPVPTHHPLQSFFPASSSFSWALEGFIFTWNHHASPWLNSVREKSTIIYRMVMGLFIIKKQLQALLIQTGPNKTLVKQYVYKRQLTNNSKEIKDFH